MRDNSESSVVLGEGRGGVSGMTGLPRCMVCRGAQGGGRVSRACRGEGKLEEF